MKAVSREVCAEREESDERAAQSDSVDGRETPNDSAAQRSAVRGACRGDERGAMETNSGARIARRTKVARKDARETKSWAV